MASKAQCKGENVATFCKNGGMASVGIQIPPSADKITTAMAPKGEAWLGVLKMVPVNKANADAENEIHKIKKNNAKG